METFLIDNGFELFTYCGVNKKFAKTITDCVTLYVWIASDSNTIEQVWCEDKPLTKFEKGGTVVFETVDTLDKLKSLLLAVS